MERNYISNVIDIKKSPVKIISILIITIIFGLSIIVYIISIEKTETDTIKFIKAVTALNNYYAGFDYNNFGGIIKSDENIQNMRNFLKQSIDDRTINTKENIMNIINYFYKEDSYNKDFFNIYKMYLDKDNQWNLYTEMLSKTPQEVEAISKIFENYQSYGFNNENIKAYTLSLATNYVVWGYIADYISFDETIELCVSICKEIQMNFQSWENYTNNFLIGYQYVYGNTIDRIEDIENNFKNIYNSISSKLFDLNFNVKLDVSDI